MSTSTIKARICCRADSNSSWTTVNPVLLSGEIGFETDTRTVKIGDGTTAWNNLSSVTPVIKTTNIGTGLTLSDGKIIIDEAYFTTFVTNIIDSYMNVATVANIKSNLSDS